MVLMVGEFKRRVLLAAWPGLSRPGGGDARVQARLISWVTAAGLGWRCCGAAC